jgi:poly(hydroxyalkanoate) depolymerase family esterase
MMKTFIPRAIGTAAGRARAGSVAGYANDLVQRTLAQHGLAPRPESSAAEDPAASLRPGVHRPGRTASRVDARSSPPVPNGASFTAETYSCADGDRRYLTYLPASASDGLQGLVVMLHGCTQTPEDFAAGSRMNALAERHRLVIVYPHQSRGENAQSCWNWFRRGDQMRDRGEPAILAGLAGQIAERHDVPSDKVFVAGLSAGGAMAAILGETYPEVFSAIGVHSGLPVGSAKDVPSAFAAMSGNPMPRGSARRAPAARAIVLHGTADSTVHPRNGHEIVAQALEAGPVQTVQTEDRGQAAGRSYTRRVTVDEAGIALIEHWEIDGLGHAWSGGSPDGSYTDSQGPDASAEIIRFFLE